MSAQHRDDALALAIMLVWKVKEDENGKQQNRFNKIYILFVY